jgi:hypothetical protein
MNYETNWIIQEHLGRIQHAELIGAQTRGLSARSADEVGPSHRNRRSGRVPSRSLLLFPFLRKHFFLLFCKDLRAFRDD